MEAKKEVYVLIYQAQEADEKGDIALAYERYLKGINLLSNLLITRGKPPASHSEFDTELKLAIKTLKTCTERLEELAEPPGSPSGSTSKLVAKSTSVVEPPASLNQQIQLSPPVVSAHMQKATRDNLLLRRIYEGRIYRCRDSRLKANLQLELQRRMSENLALARKKEADESQTRERKEREALAMAARKLLAASINGTIDVLKELDTNEAQFNPQILYASILQFDEQNQTKSVQTVHQIPHFIESLFRNNRHPISKWLRRFQRSLIDKIEPLLSKYLTKLQQKEATDLIYDFTESTEEELKQVCENRLINQLEDEALERHSEILANDLKLAFELLYQMCLMQVQNVPMDEPDHEALTLQITDHIYTLVWSRIIAIFSIVHCNSAHAFRLGCQAMLMNKSNEELRDELSAGFSSDQVLKQFNAKELAEQLSSIGTLVNPFRKLKQLTQSLRDLCSKVNCSAQIGADQLVPLLVLVLINCNSKIVVDCEAIEALASSKALLGLEGYTLSSFQTALKYIEMHGKS